ncbi:MBL fold metallo-hydrolase [Halalkalibacter nanhaiisediminis]|uniref:Metallo-beta-lactamase superfamily protein n=1 Tax=Halalkalibacter nanhaiisediminis TaxID=688079 RepID=A0A562QPS6_9BACI|nr:MBL fold metallo-hydrolase [Halalkalibacter nanhaiisediminis]TWI58066.1 metallo-beta-lactamase superfamily protein [Halalkalibacter nanhaiisediminis]
MDITLLKAGYCTQLERIAKTNGKMKNIRFPASFLLIKHPTKGIILFDTGYSNHVINAMKVFPFQIYAKTTPIYLEQGESAKEQLENMGIPAKDVTYIILSHFHVDHMGGLLDFPNAKFICSKEEYREVKDKKGFSALRNAFIPTLLPNNFAERSLYIEDTFVVETPTIGDIYPNSYDLLGDGSILGISLPGHTSHQFGILLTYKEQLYFFISDACWLSETYEKQVFPSKLAKLIIKRHHDYYENIQKLHLIHTLHPNVKIIPCHDDQVTL